MLSLFLLLAAGGADVAQSTTPAGPATVSPVVETMVEPNPKVMNQREIRAWNAKLVKTHPFYIRCVTSTEIGSLAKRLYSCRTNRQWTLSDDTGNRNARETYEAMQGKAWNSSQ